MWPGEMTRVHLSEKNGDPTLIASTHVWKKLHAADTLINPAVRKQRLMGIPGQWG